MKEYCVFLKNNKINPEYIECNVPEHDIRVLLPILVEKFESIHVYDPVDDYLSKRISKLVPKTKLFVHPNPNFLFSSKEIEAETTKKFYLQGDFYKRARKKFKILLEENGEPLGGRWSFDTENRKKFPKNQTAPKIPFYTMNATRTEAQDYIEKNFPKNPGVINPTLFPINRKEGLKNLENFLEHRFMDFGIYEDAISSKEPFLYHSLLTPCLNIGYLSPEEILKEAIDIKDIPLNSKEGFVRQILGWREFIRSIYIKEGNYQRTRNFWNFQREIPASFYTGKTGIEPIDFVVRKVLNTAYCHHIERLMILGNFFLLCEFSPNSVYKWFMELFIDAYDWVMVPNVYGMSQFADGGLMATKPYISGSNYIKKMSDLKGGDWEKIWDALFWRFLHVHSDFFSKNPRIGMLLSTWKKMDPNLRNLHLQTAEKYLNSLDK